ncbi:hypothetical protein [Streptomyces sp. UNOC14_S4]|uniref:hypothetical protein n=1 Tax=Streptomyces sp. UNOC14_S4 TaxID=2872340 RepID=UPI001E371004|nr:hypothetical protein [Streptomyces sp. UNOC14_S4]MCC3768746.1 hypothetical protein [Streptomyces sp. UNOC14_S4]
MTYRNGAFVVDTRGDRARVAQVIDSLGQQAHLRAPGGGEEWKALFSDLRLATREERARATRWPQLKRPPFDCEECSKDIAAYQEAMESGNDFRTATALVRQRTHWRLEHGL